MENDKEQKEKQGYVWNVLCVHFFESTELKRNNLFEAYKDCFYLMPASVQN